VSFDKLADPETLMRDGASFLEKFHVGSNVKVYYNSSANEFSIAKPQKGQHAKLAKGDLVVARLVKGVNGKGITV